MTDPQRLFLSPADSTPERPAERPAREFQRLVNQDLRDRWAAGPAYKILSRPENLTRWLQVLTDIRHSIHLQNAHDNAVLNAHPGRSSGDPDPEYIQAKKTIADRKRARQRTLRGVNERTGEVRRLIGTQPVTGKPLGIVVQYLVHADSMLRDGEVDDARAKLAALLRMLTTENSDRQTEE
ncbi:hypothetical protein [Nocardia wallacei]|uniref:hypothetical protein n=1 Tax=Nocardia wallacei TaxID=480035 RepID=UPI0024569162|nr:hypothetical protein [Nocardia wallacei]